MKIKNLQAILSEAEKLYAATGDLQSARGLHEFCVGLDRFASKSVSDLLKMVAKLQSTR